MTFSSWYYKATFLLVVCISLVLMLTWTTYSPRKIFARLTDNKRPKERYKQQKKSYGIRDQRDPRFYNIILEEDALMFASCQDINATVSIDNSKVILEGRFKGQFNIGDEIKAAIISYDGYGKRKTSGGDQFRVTVENKKKDASAPCVVTDNRNGIYTVICEALWAGESTIYVTLAYTREAITSIYRTRKEILATRNLYANFKSRIYKEETICHPNKTHLGKLTNYTEICDMTYVNSGMPFYCGKPTDVHLLCQDWQEVRTKEPYPKLPISECEQVSLNRGQRKLKQTLQVNVKSADMDTQVHSKPLIPCSGYNHTKLWYSRKPTGFYFNGSWIFRNCFGANETSYHYCLRNRRVYLFGDSTIRAWYTQMMKRFQCQPVTEKWQKEKWHKESECYNRKNNFRIGWYPHSQPFYVGKSWDEVRYTLHSVPRRIDNIPNGTKAIIVIHLYMHFLAFHHNVFKERMEIIRKSVEKFLHKSNGSVVMIKGPHTFEGTPAGSVRLSDYYGYVYSKILHEVFEGLHDKVVLLNNRDTTLAKHVKWNHPDDDIVNVMVNQMLNYACK